jgi:aminoglycoside phosphotransferase (APT) family kinase protein
MVGGPPDRALSRAEVEAMVAIVRPDWTVRSAVQIDEGRSSIYRLGVDTETGLRDVILKAAPSDDRPLGIDTEARLITSIKDHTDIPVPTVIGAVTTSSEVRSPFFLMDAIGGTSVPMADIGSIPDDAVRAVARETGRQLAQLHAITSLDAFGDITSERSARLTGERPSGDPTELHVRGDSGWIEWLRTAAQNDLEALEETQFSDLAAPLEDTLYDRIDAIEAAHSPVLGRLDHAFPNLRVNPDTWDIEAVIDWESSHAVPRAYDLATVARILPGASWMVLPDVPDRRDLVWKGLLDGYREYGTPPAGLCTHRAYCRLEHRVISMLSVAAGRLGDTLSERQLAQAAAHLRMQVNDVIT